jgi:arylsulfatase A-like enzyme
LSEPSLPRPLRWLAAGLVGGAVCGVAWGLGWGAVDIRAHRYPQSGLDRPAVRLLHQTVDGSAVRGAAWGAGTALAGLALAALLRRRLDPAAVLLAVPVAAGVLAQTLPRVNAARGFPDAFSPAGLALNGLLGLACVGLPLGAALALRGRARGVVDALARAFRPAAAMAVVALLLALDLSERLVTSRRPSGPNVLLISVDTLRADHLGCYGYVRDTSPRLDRLAREGVRFDQAVVQWPKTSPSMASMLSGTYPHYNGVMRNTRQPIDPHFHLLAELFQHASYATAGMITNGNLARSYRFDQGFDTYVEALQGNEPASRFSRFAVDWLEEHGADGPFFLWLHFLDPHARYEPPAPYADKFVGDAHYDGVERVPRRGGPFEDIGGIPSRARLGSRDELDFYVAQYDGEVSFMDAEVGRVLDLLDSLGVADDTIVVFTADHGESLGEHDYYFEHGRLPYDDCVRVPLIVRAPGVAPGRVVDRPVELVDLMPTLLEMAGLPSNSEAQGKSLVPLLRGVDGYDRRYAFTESGYLENYQRAVRDGRWKLVYAPDPADQAIMAGVPFELYDLRADPGETRNLVHERADVARELSRVLLDWMRAAPPSPVRAGREVVTDKATEENLRSLGYIQ